jgi:hypothetical protein
MIKIFTLKMARYLIEKGFLCINVKPNPKQPWYNMYEFEDSPALHCAMTQYTLKLKAKQEA